MNTISNYLDSLFMNIPQTPETDKAKADLLATMEDHYYALLEEGHSENEAIGSVISEFGSIDELLEELEITQETPTFTQSSFEAPIQLMEAERYWQKIRNFSLKIASGILLCCIGVAALLVFANYNSSVFGLTLLFLFLAIGTAMFITGGLSFSRETKIVADRPIPLNVQKAAALHVNNYRKSFTLSLVLGISICIVSFIPIFLFQYTYRGAFGIACFMIGAGLGTFLIVYGSIIYTYYQKFADQMIYVPNDDEPGPNARQQLYGPQHPLINFLEKVYWPIVLVVYFWFSFGSGNWGSSWLIFIIAGPLFEGLKTLFRVQNKQS